MPSPKALKTEGSHLKEDIDFAKAAKQYTPWQQDDRNQIQRI